jgi:DTW domain-containing protein
VTSFVVPQGRCYGCWRPRQACFCAAIPRIDNRTEVLILQHQRERSHRFNTARIVHNSLHNSRLLVDHIGRLASRLNLKAGAGLLYPGPGAQPMSDLPREQHPKQLVVLDGTWHHAKTLIREIPALRPLPRYGLLPASPSRYRIRRAPSATALSTVEATVAALRILEPETDGFDQLLRAFDIMVEGQLAHSGSASSPRFRRRIHRTFKNIPLALLGDLRNVVIAYGESAAGQRGCKRHVGPPIYWVAQRLVSGEIFACALKPPSPLDETFLGHLELTWGDFARAVDLDEAQRQWSQFHRPGDVVTVFQPGTAHLFPYLTADGDSCLVLKSIDLDSNGRGMTLEDLLSAHEIQVGPPKTNGRAGRRLAQAVALVGHLNALGNSHLRAPSDNIGGCDLGTESE